MFNIVSCDDSSKVIYSCELPEEIASQDYSIQLGFAVQQAVKANVCLSGTNLSFANLYGANLFGVDFSHANLSYVDFSRSNLSHVNFFHANLYGVDLYGTNLYCTNFSGVDLYGVDLSGTYLSDAYLSDAELSVFKQDMIAEVLRMPNELEFLRDAIVNGKIDGSTYSGKCACLAGTIAIARGIKGYKGDTIPNGIEFHADASSPRERWFAVIKEGDTPKNNQASKLALEWLDEAIAIRNNIRNYT